MKIDIDYLKNTFRLGYETFQDSRDKALKVLEMYHNRQYTESELRKLKAINRIPETFNIIKLFSRQLMGYYSKTFNQVALKGRQLEDVLTASLLNDVYSYINYSNYYHNVFNKIKFDGIISGLMVEYLNVVPKKDRLGNIKKDQFGRTLYNIKKEYVPFYEIVLDPLSVADDYSDARFIHRFKWVDKIALRQLFPNKDLSKLTPNENTIEYKEGELQFRFGDNFSRQDEMDYYLLVHSIIRDGNKSYSIYWVGDKIIDKQEITYREVPFPYVVTKVNISNKPEFYGVFNDVYESQRVINQALLQIQYMLSSDKVFVEENAVEDMAEFEKAYKRISAIIPVNYLAGIRIDKLSTEIQQQYIVIDRAFDRIQKVLGINDSFLGMAFASDSGRKVQLQKQATIVGLQYLDDAFELFSRIDAQKVLALVQQFFRANQILSIVDKKLGDRWIELNRPMINPMTGQPFWEQAIDPNTGKPMVDKWGRPIVVPLNDPDTDIAFTEYDIIIEKVDYNDDEQNQVMIETVANGLGGQMLMSVNPAAYAKLMAMLIKQTKTRYSQDVAALFEETAQMLQPQPQNQQFLGYGATNSNTGGANNGSAGINYISGENSNKKGR